MMHQPGKSFNQHANYRRSIGEFANKNSSIKQKKAVLFQPRKAEQPIDYLTLTNSHASWAATVPTNLRLPATHPFFVLLLMSSFILPTTLAAESGSKAIWDENSLSAYKEFISYANMNSIVDSNIAIKNSLGGSSDLIVHSKAGKFASMELFPSDAVYCSKITIRNFDHADFVFNFDKDVIERSLAIMPTSRIRKNVDIAYRNIVPSEFREARTIAGPMGFHEYILDGSKIKNHAPIRFFANSNFKETPIRIVLENCQGRISVNGLSEEQAARVFANTPVERLSLDPEYFDSHGPSKKSARF